MNCSGGSDLVLLWLWCRPVTTAPIRPLAWEPPYASGAALEKAKRQKKKKGARNVRVVEMSFIALQIMLPRKEQVKEHIKVKCMCLE